MATDLAEHLGSMGWEVTVITGFPMMPNWEVSESYRSKLYMHERRGATHIHRSWVYVPTRPKHGLMSTWKRVAFDTSLILTSLPKLLGTGFDAIVAIGPPLQTGFAALLAKRVWGSPVLYWMQDIVPTRP